MVMIGMVDSFLLDTREAPVGTLAAGGREKSNLPDGRQAG
jgi:hypothetical protein